MQKYDLIRERIEAGPHGKLGLSRIETAAENYWRFVAEIYGRTLYVSTPLRELASDREFEKATGLKLQMDSVAVTIGLSADDYKVVQEEYEERYNWGYAD